MKIKIIPGNGKEKINMDEVDLVKKSKKGDGDAFSILIKSYEKDLYRVAISMLKNDDDALDCIQDAILKAFEKVERLEDERYFKTWLIKILINRCNDALAKRNKIVVLSEINKGLSYSENTEKIEVKEFLDKLEEDLKIIVILYYFEDLSVKDIAENLNIPEGTVKSRLSRARNKLKTLMNIECEEMI